MYVMGTRPQPQLRSKTKTQTRTRTDVGYNNGSHCPIAIGRSTSANQRPACYNKQTTRRTDDQTREVHDVSPY